MSGNLQVRARHYVREYVNEQLEKSHDEHIGLNQVQLLWFSKVVDNWLALCTTEIPNGMYYEVIYDSEINTTYVTAYKLFNQKKINNDDEGNFK